MPSGAKKRKAARRKKGEQELGGIQHPPSPHSPTSTPQGSSGLESESSDRGEADMESSGSGGRGEEAVRGEDAGEDYEVREVGVEYVVTKKDTNGSSTHLEEVEPPAAAADDDDDDDEVPISEVVVLEQQTAEASASPLAQEETSVATDIPPVSTACEEQQVAPAPLLGHRATLWNCCGLLDAFKGNQR
ncbi:uncharacterized protein M6B38_395500 [Iris pallida]|uniref:Uncharacterized protein n=1 Tax=Iris pallida TaxID=29817 RepID=A0AAX6FWS9_IRIPA|nr:uncharacterized protein M6B38_395500 [Iris pallida]